MIFLGLLQNWPHSIETLVSRTGQAVADKIKWYEDRKNCVKHWSRIIRGFSIIPIMGGMFIPILISNI